MTTNIGNACLNLEEFFQVYKPSRALVDLRPRLEGILPPGVDFASNRWELISWVTRPGNASSYTVCYDEIRNPGLRDCLKVFTLHKRLTALVSAGAARFFLHTFKFLDKTLMMKDLTLIRNAHFYEAEKIIVGTCSRTAPRRNADYLKDVGQWLTWQMGIPISYEPTLPTVHRHGRKGPEEGRQNKLMSTSVIHDMIAANKRDDLLEKDRFFLSAFVLLVATGFRINELATLPKNCLLQDKENKTTSLRYFPECEPACKNDPPLGQIGVQN